MLSFNMERLLSQTQKEYKIERKISTIAKGVASYDNIYFDIIMTVTNAKKEDMEAFGLGNKNASMLKLRVLKSESIELMIGDYLIFDNDKYKITRKRPYQEGISDFRIYYALLDVK